MFDSTAIPGALLDLIDPEIVDGASTGIVELPLGIGVGDGLAVDHTAVVEPVHVFMADAGREVSILLDGVVEGAAVELATRLVVLDRVVETCLADAFSGVGGRTYGRGDFGAIGDAVVGRDVEEVAGDANAGSSLGLHVGRADAFVEGSTPDKANNAGAFCIADCRSRGVGNLRAVEDTLPGEGVPAQIVAAVALVGIWLGVKGILDLAAVDDALP
jgi:hypothetical protein